MEFWGVEVKSGEPLSVKPGDDYVIHLSQACIGEVKKDKGSDSIYLYVEVDDQKLVLGRLSGEKFPQLSFDVMFDKEFQLSHNWKNGSVHFCGYKSYRHESDGDDDDDDDDLEGYDFPEDLPVASGNNINGKSQSPAPIAEKASASKPDSAAGKRKVNIVESKKKNVSSSDDDSDDKDSDSEDQVMANVESESDDEDKSEDDDSSDDDEETPKKVEPSKKRPVNSATKTPAPEKKAKFVTPQKTDGKKGVVHVATPHPSKHASKASTSNEQAKQQLPSSGGSISCKSCNRTFKSDQALQSHTKAKHSAAA